MSQPKAELYVKHPDGTYSEAPCCDICGAPYEQAGSSSHPTICPRCRPQSQQGSGWVAFAECTPRADDYPIWTWSPKNTECQLAMELTVRSQRNCQPTHWQPATVPAPPKPVERSLEKDDDESWLAQFDMHYYQTESEPLMRKTWHAALQHERKAVRALMRSCIPANANGIITPTDSWELWKKLAERVGLSKP